MKRILDDVKSASSASWPAGNVELATDEASVLGFSRVVNSLFSRLGELGEVSSAGLPPGLIEGCEKLAAAIEEWENCLPRTPADEAEDHHDRGGGAVVVDLDEAVHGVYASIAYLVQALKGGGSITKEFSDNAQLLIHSPIGWVKDTGVPRGVADSSIAISVAAALLPLAFLAMKAGVEEMRGAAHTRKEISAKLTLIERDIRGIDRLLTASAQHATGAGLPANARGLLSSLRAASEERERALTFLLDQNKADGRIGLFSAGAGVSIATKAATDVVTKTAFVATGAHPAALSAAGAAGVAGTFVLGPAAAAGAIGLGTYMVRKSDQKRDAFRLDKNATEQHIADLLGKADSTPAITAYREFLTQELGQHDAFLGYYTKWNKRFLAGSTLYGGSVLAKVATVSAVAAGATPVAHPATLATLLALGTAGGVVMGASSHQFLTGHGRLHRYQGYYIDDDPELDREFLASLDLLLANGADSDPLAGLELRSAFLWQMLMCEDERQTLLQSVSDDLGKRYADRHTYPADPDFIQERRGPRRTGAQRARDVAKRAVGDTRGRLRAAMHYAGHTMRMHGTATARQAARSAWNDSRDYLTRASLKSWLANPGNISAQIDMMTAVLDTQLGYMEAKLDAKTAAYGHFVSHGSRQHVGSNANVLDAPDGMKMKKILVALDKDLEHDHLRYAQAIAVRANLGAIAELSRSGALIAESGWSTAIDRFVTLQKGETYDPHARIRSLDASRHDLATYWMKDAPKRYRDLRGKLIETELQATRLREQVALTSA
ncbi:hypothetical protein LJR230_002318 [Trinickia sp. LjRoot230]|uniref:hypothetical protein n=1 Tax=Trinickia sp. LjRoot230 TaxID=3342288 RepID=UPI003ED03A52